MTAFLPLADGGLPLFRLERDDYSVFYAPGYLAVTPAAEARTFAAALAEPSSPGVAAELLQRAKAAQELRSPRAAGAFRPVSLILYLNNECPLGCTYCYADPSLTRGDRLTMRGIESRGRGRAGELPGSRAAVRRRVPRRRRANPSPLGAVRGAGNAGGAGRRNPRASVPLRRDKRRRRAHARRVARPALRSGRPVVRRSARHPGPAAAHRRRPADLCLCRADGRDRPRAGRVAAGAGDHHARDGAAPAGDCGLSVPCDPAGRDCRGTGLPGGPRRGHRGLRTRRCERVCRCVPGGRGRRQAVRGCLDQLGQPAVGGARSVLRRAARRRYPRAGRRGDDVLPLHGRRRGGTRRCGRRPDRRSALRTGRGRRSCPADPARSPTGALRGCFNQYHCALTCPDACVLDRDAGPEGFLCRVRRALAQARVETQAAALWNGPARRLQVSGAAVEP